MHRSLVPVAFRLAEQTDRSLCYGTLTAGEEQADRFVDDLPLLWHANGRTRLLIVASKRIARVDIGMPLGANGSLLLITARPSKSPAWHSAGERSPSAPAPAPEQESFFSL